MEDILADDRLMFGWDFRNSILKDICRGMDYLHSSDIESHGRLKSSNCLVDRQWTCKISGNMAVVSHSLVVIGAVSYKNYLTES